MYILISETQTCQYDRLYIFVILAFTTKQEETFTHKLFRCLLAITYVNIGLTGVEEVGVALPEPRLLLL